MPSTSNKQPSTSSMDLTEPLNFTIYTRKSLEDGWSSIAMELTQPLNATIYTRKCPLEAEEEELELLEEFQPLAVSTPNVSSYTVPDMLVAYIITGKKPS